MERWSQLGWQVRTKSPSPKSPSPFTRSRSAGRDGKSQELVTTTGAAFHLMPGQKIFKFGDPRPWTLIIFERNEIDTLTLPIAIERARNVWTMCKNETCRWKHLVLRGHFYCSYAIVERLCWNAASFGQRKERGTELFQCWSISRMLPTMLKIHSVDFYLPGETDSFHGVASQMGYVQRRTMSNRGRKKRRGHAAWHQQSSADFRVEILFFKQLLDLWISVGFVGFFCWGRRSGSSWNRKFQSFGEMIIQILFLNDAYMNVSRRSGLVWDSLGNMSRSTDWLEDIGSHYCTAHSIWRQKCIIAQQLQAHTILQHVYAYNRVYESLCTYTFRQYKSENQTTSTRIMNLLRKDIVTLHWLPKHPISRFCL